MTIQRMTLRMFDAQNSIVQESVNVTGWDVLGNWLKATIALPGQDAYTKIHVIRIPDNVVRITQV